MDEEVFDSWFSQHFLVHALALRLEYSPYLDLGGRGQK